MVKMSNENKRSQVSPAQPGTEQKQRNSPFCTSHLVWVLLGVLETLIAIRIGLGLIGANPDNPVFSLIYGVTYLFLFPITGSINSPVAGSAVFEISALFAMMIYVLIASVIEKVIWLLLYHPIEPIAENRPANDERNTVHSQRSANE